MEGFVERELAKLLAQGVPGNDPLLDTVAQVRTWSKTSRPLEGCKSQGLLSPVNSRVPWLVEGQALL